MSRNVTTPSSNSDWPMTAANGIMFSSQYWNCVKSLGFAFAIVSVCDTSQELFRKRKIWLQLTAPVKDYEN
jgi:hypothetical protein